MSTRLLTTHLIPIMRILPIVAIVFGLYPACTIGQQVANLEGSDNPEPINYYVQIAEIGKELLSNPSSAELRIQRATCFIKIKEFEYAIADLDTALSYNPGNASIYYMKGVTFSKRTQFVDAMEQLDIAISIEPGNIDYLFFRAMIFAQQEDFRLAILDLNSILAIDPLNADCYLQKALWCESLNMYYECIKNYIYFIMVSKDDLNTNLVNKRLKRLIKSDKYFKDLYKEAKKEIRHNPLPWNQ